VLASVTGDQTTIDSAVSSFSLFRCFCNFAIYYVFIDFLLHVRTGVGKQGEKEKEDEIKRRKSRRRKPPFIRSPAYGLFLCGNHDYYFSLFFGLHIFKAKPINFCWPTHEYASLFIFKKYGLVQFYWFAAFRTAVASFDLKSPFLV
jgi:hypothetical protein